MRARGTTTTRNASPKKATRRDCAPRMATLREPAPREPTPRKSAAGAAIHCADCLHCKVFKKHSRSGRYILLARCAMGKWTRGTKNLTEVTPPIHTLPRRCMRVCPYYDSLSEDDADRQRYLAELADELPDEEYVYEPDGSFVDMTEVPRWHPDI